MSKDKQKQQNIKADLKYALVAGGISFVIIIIGAGLMGGLSGANPLKLAQAALQHMHTLTSTFIRALSTILALMLTLLGLSSGLKVKFKWAYYLRIKHISFGIAITLIAAIVVYLFLNFPVGQTGQASSQWFAFIYYSCLVLGALLGGSFITIIIYLYKTISEVIEIFDPDQSYKLLTKDKKE